MLTKDILILAMQAIATERSTYSCCAVQKAANEETPFGPIRREYEVRLLSALGRSPDAFGSTYIAGAALQDHLSALLGIPFVDLEGHMVGVRLGLMLAMLPNVK